MASKRTMKAKKAPVRKRATDPFALGKAAYNANKTLGHNPYLNDETLAKRWALGWVEGMRRS